MNNKILLIMPYFERPKMVRNALNSFRHINYKNFTIAIIDDGSINDPIAHILKEEYPDLLEKIIIYETGDTLENKKIRGSIHGTYMNKAIREIDSDIVVMMSDDDAIHQEYFLNLDNFYSNNPLIMYSYSHVVLFDPFQQHPCNSLQFYNRNKIWNTGATTHLNLLTPINPYCKVDATQVSWRRKCNLERNIWFPEEQTKNLDASFYSQMFEQLGECNFNGFVSCFKGMHEDQLTNRIQNGQYQPRDLSKKNSYASICAIINNESKNLQEWLEHHIKIGFEHFYLYDDSDNNEYQKILKPFFDKGFITLKKIPKSGSIVEAHADFLENYKFKTFWAIFMGVDNYILPESTDFDKITEILPKFSDFAAVVVQQDFMLFNPRKILIESVTKDRILFDSLLSYPKFPIPVNRNFAYMIKDDIK